MKTVMLSIVTAALLVVIQGEQSANQPPTPLDEKQRLAGSAWAALSEPLIQGNPGERELSVRALGGVAGASARSLLLSAMEDRFSNVRAAAIWVLGKRPEKLNILLLEKGLMDPESSVRARTVEAIGNRGDEEHLPLLARIMHEGSQIVKRAGCDGQDFRDRGLEGSLDD
ncbi:MAG: HEAT repeat domain-containing protein [Acidobacteriota bacterium]